MKCKWNASIWTKKKYVHAEKAAIITIMYLNWRFLCVFPNAHTIHIAHEHTFHSSRRGEYRIISANGDVKCTAVRRFEWKNRRQWKLTQNNGGRYEKDLFALIRLTADQQQRNRGPRYVCDCTHFRTHAPPTRLNNCILIGMDDFMRRHCSDRQHRLDGATQ